MTLTLYGNTASRTVRAIWYAEEVGMEINLIKEPPQGEKIRKLSPLGQIPLLQDGDLLLRDSVVILKYLADKNGGLTFAPGTAKRAELDARMAFLTTDLEAPLWLWYRRTVASGDTETAPELKALMQEDFARAEKGLMRLMQDAPFVMGEAFTIADILAGHIGAWAARVGFEPATSAFQAYLDRVTSRPALASARAR